MTKKKLMVVAVFVVALMSVFMLVGCGWFGSLLPNVITMSDGTDWVEVSGVGSGARTWIRNISAQELENMHADVSIVGGTAHVYIIQGELRVRTNLRTSAITAGTINVDTAGVVPGQQFTIEITVDNITAGSVRIIWGRAPIGMG